MISSLPRPSSYREGDAEEEPSTKETKDPCTSPSKRSLSVIASQKDHSDQPHCRPTSSSSSRRPRSSLTFIYNPSATQPHQPESAFHMLLASRMIEKDSDTWAYRAYIPTLPCANKIVQLKWDVSAKLAHREKVKQASHSIDSKEPPKYKHLIERTRKQRVMHDTETKIYLENKNLLNRIKKQISSIPTPVPSHTTTGKARPQPPSPDSIIRKHGLNGPRNRTLKKQTEQANQIFLQRIESSAPHYNQQSFKKDRIHTLLHLQNISRFPKRYVQELAARGILIQRSASPAASRHSRASSSTSARPASVESPESPRSDARMQQDGTGGIRNSVTSDASLESERVPLRWVPRAPLVPRVAAVRTQAVETGELPGAQRGTGRKVPLVPRVALIAAQKQREGREAEIRLQSVKKKEFGVVPEVVYGAEVAVGYEFEEEFPGDEELFLPNDVWSLTPLGVSVAKRLDPIKTANVVPGKEARSAWKPTAVDDEAFVKGMVTGMALAKSFQFSVVKNHVCKLYVSSSQNKLLDERVWFVEQILLPLRNYCMSLGIEFQWNDLRFDETQNNGTFAKDEKVRKWCLEKCLRDSILFNHIAFFDADTYGDSSIPSEIDACVFDQIAAQANYLRIPLLIPMNLTASEFLNVWYTLDENWLVPKRIIQSPHKVIPKSEGPDAVITWICLLKKLLKIAAVTLGRSGLLEPSSVQRFVQSEFQEEVLRGIVKQSRRGDWFKSLLYIHSSVSPDDSSSYEENNKPDKGEARLLDKLSDYLFSSVPDGNRMETLDHESAFITNSTGTLLNSLKDNIQNGISFIAENRMESNELLSEIGLHNAQLKLRAKDHGLRGHLTEKVISYLARADCNALPPLLVVGEHKTSLIGKSIQIYLHKVAESSQHQNATTGSTALESAASLTSTATSASESGSRRPRSAGSNSGFAGARTISFVQPVIIARIVGLSPDSRTAIGLMKSMTHQICMAYGIIANFHEEVTVDLFREAMKFATSDRPLIIALAKADILPLTGPFSRNISWLVDGIPPFVKVVVSASKAEIQGLVIERIKTHATSLVYAAAKNGPPPSPFELQNAHEPFVISIGEIIFPVLKTCIKRMTEQHGRRLQIEQEEAIRNAFMDCERVNGIIPAKMLKLLHSTTRKWTHLDSIRISFPRSVSRAYEYVLLELENEHGRLLVQFFFSLLVTSTEGLTQSELLDMIALNPNTRDFATTSTGLPTNYPLVRLLFDVKNYLIHRDMWGGEVLSVIDLDLTEVIKMRYLTSVESQTEVAKYISDYFSNNFAAFQKTVDMPWKFSSGRLSWNQRKYTELPNAMLKSSSPHEIRKLFENIEFLEGFIVSQGPRWALSWIMRFLNQHSDRETPDINELKCYLESIFDFIRVNQEILSQTPAQHCDSFLKDLLSRLPSRHLLQRLKSQCKTTEEQVFNVHKAWSIVSDVSSRHPNSTIEEIADVVTSDLNQTSYFVRRIGKLPIKSADCTIEGNSRMVAQKQYYSRPCTTMFHENHKLLATSPDGRFLASGSSDGKVRLYDTMTWEHVTTFLVSARITGLHFEPNNIHCENLLICSSGHGPGNDHKVARWSLTKELPTATITGKRHGLRYGVASSGFLRDDKGRTCNRAFGLSLNSTLVVWELNTREVLKTVAPDTEDDEMLLSGSATVSNDGKLLAFGIRSIRIMNAETLTIIWNQPLHITNAFFLHGISHINFRQNATSLIVISDKGERMSKLGQDTRSSHGEWRTAMQIIEIMQNESPKRKIWTSESSFSALSVLEEQNFVAVGGLDGVVEIINLKNGTQHAIQILTHSVACLVPLIDQDEHSHQVDDHHYTRKTHWDASLRKESPHRCFRIAASSVDGMIQILPFRSDPETVSKSDHILAMCTKDGSNLVTISSPLKVSALAEVDITIMATPQSEEPRRFSTSGKSPSLETMAEMIVRARSGIYDDGNLPKRDHVITGSSSLKRSVNDTSLGTRKSNKSVTFAPSLPDIRPTEVVDITLWEAETGRKLATIPICAEIIWCDFESNHQGEQTMVTGERNGTVKIWDWLLNSDMSTKRQTDVAYAEFSVCNDTKKLVSGYSLNMDGSLLAVALSNAAFNEQGSQEEADPFSTSIELWNFKTTEKLLEQSKIFVASLPSVRGPLSVPLLGLTWSYPAAILSPHFPKRPGSKNLPACLAVGAERLLASADHAPIKCTNLTAFIRSKLGVDALARCTASRQSPFDPSILLFAMDDSVYWTQEGALLPTDYDDVNDTTEDSRVDIAPKFRIRKVSSPVGETVISLHHLKTASLDVVVVATDFGTVALYDLSLPKDFFKEYNGDVVRNPTPLVSVWYGRLPLKGMYLVDSSLPQTLSRRKERRAVLWGRGGFVTVLDILLS
ncbi:hypothetical protein BC830DRAFT_1231475 [Chytriomyces sp. MP71]|nr:hypothetical protein BC830DRAFT_1231475 [Chytriomyces sp. MP71]